MLQLMQIGSLSMMVFFVLFLNNISIFFPRVLIMEHQ